MRKERCARLKRLGNAQTLGHSPLVGRVDRSHPRAKDFYQAETQLCKFLSYIMISDSISSLFLYQEKKEPREKPRKKEASRLVRLVAFVLAHLVLINVLGKSQRDSLVA